MKRLILGLLGLMAAVSPTFAHTGIGDTHGVTHGFMHPVSGFDHILAMVAVGLFAFTLGGRAIWAVPLTFVATMGIAGMVGMSGIPLPMVETGIGLSVVALGVVLAFRVTMPLALAIAFVGFFAIFHGYAHGVEMPDSSSSLAYGIGFVAATALLHAAWRAVQSTRTDAPHPGELCPLTCGRR